MTTANKYSRCTSRLLQAHSCQQPTFCCAKRREDAAQCKSCSWCWSQRYACCPSGRQLLLHFYCFHSISHFGTMFGMFCSRIFGRKKTSFQPNQEGKFRLLFLVLSCDRAAMYRGLFLVFNIFIVVIVVGFVAAQSPLEAKVLDDLRNEWNLTNIGWHGNSSDACSSNWQGVNCYSAGHIIRLYAIHEHSIYIWCI